MSEDKETPERRRERLRQEKEGIRKKQPFLLRKVAFLTFHHLRRTSIY